MTRISAKTAKVLPRTWSPNQVVAHNLTRARLLRGWTQDQAAEALAPYLGTRLSLASFSAIERSIAGTRVKQFTADELVALTRLRPAARLVVHPTQNGAMHTPDHPRTGVDFDELVEVVPGTPDTLPAWTDALEQWAAGPPAPGDARRGALTTPSRSNSAPAPRPRTFRGRQRSPRRPAPHRRPPRRAGRAGTDRHGPGGSAKAPHPPDPIDDIAVVGSRLSGGLAGLAEEAAVDHELESPARDHDPATQTRCGSSPRVTSS